MSATITGTLAKRTELGGDCKLYIITATIGAASDTITLTQATHGITTIYGITGLTVKTGLDDHYTFNQISFSGLVITIAGLKANGAAADDFTSITVSVGVIGKSE
jgi:hypothetical protein